MTAPDHALDDRVPPPRRTPAQLLAEGAAAVPQLVRLLVSLIRDPRVPRRPKLIAGGVVLYVISPFDLLPDSIPFVGRLDDVVLVAAALDLLLEAAPAAVVEELWTGGQDTLEIVTGLSRFIAGLMPKPLRRLLTTARS